ncbi:hypothetical protein COW53_08595 [bacterium CG17_big_fil_post_rev_8_21_14_2_50_64_8]|nr:MAG: hypothetical protein COW53_08595 [bacterium CG17_big_fil_post_rev_8_21_14_2_50_64_8]
MHPQLQQLVALQDMMGMIREIEEKGSELGDMGFKTAGLDDLKNAREELEGKIDPQVMGLFRRLTGKFGRAVVPVIGNSCTGCFALIPASFVSKTNAGRLQYCESCGRILYWP